MATKIQLNKETEGNFAVRAPIIKDIGPGILMFLISRASVLSLFPFSTAFFAAYFDKSIAYIGVTIMTIGLFSAGARIEVVKYIMSALLFWLFDKVNTKSEKSTILSAAACGISVCTGGLFLLIANFEGIYDVLMLLSEGIIASLMYIIFKKSDNLIKTRQKRSQAAKDEIVSVAISAGVIITGLSGVVFPLNISLCTVASLYAVMTIAYQSSLSASGSVGLAIGFITSMNSPNAILMMGIMGLSALFANLLKTFGKIGVTVGMIGAVASAMLYAGRDFNMPINMYEVGVGAVLFLITPGRLHSFIRAFFSNNLVIENISIEMRVKDYLASRLSSISNAFSELNLCFMDSSQKRLKLYSREIGSMFDDVTERVCADCPMSNKCWQSDFSGTYKQIMAMLDTIEKEGVLLVAPEAFSLRCDRADRFVLEFNHVYEIYKTELMQKGRAITARDLVTSQYKEISDMMDKCSKDICEGFTFREDFEETAVNEMDKYGINLFEISVVESTNGRLEIFAGLGVGTDIKRAEAVFSEITATPIGYDGTDKNGIMKFTSKARYSVDFAVRQKCKDHGRINGDSVSVFSDDDYRMYFLISDGMGSGKKASTESKITLNLLEKFLKAGFGVKNAIEVINSSLCLKLDNECFSTIDLMVVDLMMGYAEFYKIGSAQSFVYSEGNVDTIFSASIPVGMLKSVKVTPQRRKLYDGDTILMLSDGVSEAGFSTSRSEWIKKEITSLCDNMEDMADNILHTAIRKSRNTVVDDMSIIAIRLEEI